MGWSSSALGEPCSLDLVLAVSCPTAPGTRALTMGPVCVGQGRQGLSCPRWGSWPLLSLAGVGGAAGLCSSLSDGPRDSGLTGLGFASSLLLPTCWL